MVSFQDSNTSSSAARMYFLPSDRSSAHATTRGGGPTPRIGFIALRSSSFRSDDLSGDEITFSAALTILDVDLECNIVCEPNYMMTSTQAKVVARVQLTDSFLSRIPFEPHLPQTRRIPSESPKDCRHVPLATSK